jgi:nucleotide-binding universal stress UspA family protein
MSEYRTFVVPYDFSDHARAALDTALDLAGRLGAEIHLVHVIQAPLYAYPPFEGAGAAAIVNVNEIREGVLKSLREIVEGLGGGVEVKIQVAEGGTVDGKIREIATELGADLILMGTHGRTGIAHAFLGSVTERTLRRSPCPVLTVQAEEK